MPPIETIYIIHHSHTDFGFTHDLPVYFEMQDRFLDEALDSARSTRARPPTRASAGPSRPQTCCATG